MLKTLEIIFESQLFIKQKQKQKILNLQLTSKILSLKNNEFFN